MPQVIIVESIDLITADLTDVNGVRSVEMMPFENAASRWEWLDEYREDLESGLAVFSAEGVFVRSEVYSKETR